MAGRERTDLFDVFVLVALGAEGYQTGGVGVWWLHCEACEEVNKEERSRELASLLVLLGERKCKMVLPLH